MKLFWMNLSLCLFVLNLTSMANDEGIPLGGIGTGKIELLPNGGFGAFTINQHIHEPLPNRGDTFAAVYVNIGETPIIKKLVTGDPQGVESVYTQDVFPFEKTVYEDSALPVNVKLEAYSPMFIRDARKSAVPGVVLKYTVENHTEKEVEAAIALSMQNMISGRLYQQGILYEMGEVQHSVDSSGGEQGIEMRFIPQDKSGITGDITLMAQSQRGDVVSFLPVWDTSNNDSWMAYGLDGQFSKFKDKRVNQNVDQTNRPSSAIAVKRIIPANGTSTFIFTIAWHSPNWKSSNGETYTAYYADDWDSSKKTAEELMDEDGRNRQKMDEWVTRMTAAGLPAPMMASVMNGFKELIRKSVWLKDGRFSLLSRDPEWHGNLGTPEERLSMLPFFLHCFPELLRSELEVLMTMQLVSGEVPSFVGQAGGQFGTLDVDGAFLNRPDSTISFVLLLYQNYIWTGDPEYLEIIYPHIRSAIGWLLIQDTSGDGVPDGDSWIAGTESGTLPLWTADSFLAALRVGEEIGVMKNDIVFQNRCAKALRRIADHVIAQLWNGSRFHAQFNSSQPYQKGDESVFPGFWYSRLNGWNPHFGMEKMRLAIKDGSQRKKIHAVNQSVLWDFGYTVDDYDSLSASQSMSAWAVWNRMAGISVDMPRKGLILSPVVMEGQHSVEYPLLTPSIDGRLQVRHTQRTGIIECDIFFEQQWGEKNFELQEISYMPRGGQDPSRFALYVIHEDQIMNGQDFIREGIRVFRFARPVKFSRGDQISLTAAPLEGGKMVVDVDQGRVINMGANCTVEPLRIRHDQVSFRLINLQEENQLVRLETGGQDAAEFTVYLNGQSIGSAAGGMSTVPLFLRASPVSSSDYTWLNYARSGCIDAVQYMDELNLKSLSSRLWKLQEEIESAYNADAGLRGYQVDILSPEAVLEGNPDDFDMDPYFVEKRINKAREELKDFLNDLPALSRDPVLAADITGFFVPLKMQTEITGLKMNQEPFSIKVGVSNDAGLQARARVGIEIPDGWQYTTVGILETELDPITSSFDCEYVIQPNSALQNERYGIRLVLSGSWQGHAFRRYVDLAVGHHFVKTWMVAGSFENNGGEGFEQRNPIELNIKTDETYKSGDRDIAWKEMMYPHGFVDMDSTFTPNDDVVGYAYTAVYSPREQRTLVHLGADEGVKVFHNYQEVYSKYRTSSLRPGTERFGLRLYEGWNHIMVKVQEHQGVWGFFFEITDLKEQHIPELQYALNKSRN